MKIDVLSTSMSTAVTRVQPWHYVSAVAAGLAARGHEVRLVSDVPVARAVRIPGVNYLFDPARLGRDSRTRSRDGRERPDALVYHVGGTSVFSGPRPTHSAPTIAIFTTPLYRVRDFARIAPDVFRSPFDYAGLAITTVTPRRALAHYLSANFAQTVVLDRHCAQQLASAGHPASRLTTVPPGKDAAIRRHRCEPSSEGIQVAFAGNLSSIRGGDIVLRAFLKAGAQVPDLRLAMLVRQDQTRRDRDAERLRAIAAGSPLHSRIKFRSPSNRAEFLRELCRAHALLLPFRLVPSEAPLLPIEAATLGIPLIASDLPSLRSVSAPGTLFVRPGDVNSLADAMVRFSAHPTLGSQMRALAEESDRARADWAATSARFEAVIHHAACSDDGSSQ